ncbi:MAG: hypothetical protein HYV93_14090 [Candidatus Rokubacteria bacterium]|nr:hypothetical protein [Candidatus Rokubacteria bacterium]
MARSVSSRRSAHRALRTAGLSLLALLLASGGATGEQARSSAPSRAERDFLDRHWTRPVPPQGSPPARFSEVEGSLAPGSCGVCHPAQLADWKTSLHAGAMGPGVAGQLVEMARSDPESARECLTCHAPLAEQQPVIAGPTGPVANPRFDTALHQAGLVCAACHVRRHERFGPPRRDGSLVSEAPPPGLPHNGATRTSAFLRAEFCASCHQFSPGGFALNGKLLQNTYAEWRASPAARQGLQCQDCHMPDRRHLWRGIHDSDMVKSGVEISLVTDRPRYRLGQTLRATLTIASRRVGHHFPTYVTPRVVIRAELIDGTGQTVTGSVQEQAIARDVTLDLSREVADTRLAPGARRIIGYRHRIERPDLRLRVTISVHPDHFYTRFFESLLASGAGAGEGQIREALEATRRSQFTLYQREIPLS